VIISKSTVFDLSTF